MIQQVKLKNLQLNWYPCIINLCTFLLDNHHYRVLIERCHRKKDYTASVVGNRALLPRSRRDWRVAPSFPTPNDATEMERSGATYNPANNHTIKGIMGNGRCAASIALQKSTLGVWIKPGQPSFSTHSHFNFRSMGSNK